MKNEKGITLIALVITIIVLLILAGISIAMISGEDGILGRAKSASVESKLAEDKEAAIMDLNAAYTAYMEEKFVNNNTTYDNFVNFVKNENGTYLNDSKHYTFDNTSANITTVHPAKNGNVQSATVQEKGGVGDWSDAAK